MHDNDMMHKQLFEMECDHYRGQIQAKRVSNIRKLALTRLAQRQGRLTDVNTQVAVKEAIEHATRAYDAVMAFEVPNA